MKNYYSVGYCSYEAATLRPTFAAISGTNNGIQVTSSSDALQKDSIIFINPDRISGLVYLDAKQFCKNSCTLVAFSDKAITAPVMHVFDDFNVSIAMQLENREIELEECRNCLLKGKKYYSPNYLLKHQRPAKTLKDLTEKEFYALSLFNMGLNTKAIGYEMNLTENHVSQIFKGIKKKFEADSIQAVISHLELFL